MPEIAVMEVIGRRLNILRKSGELLVGTAERLVFAGRRRKSDWRNCDVGHIGRRCELLLATGRSLLQIIYPV